jgi:hypothetical protein
VDFFESTPEPSPRPSQGPGRQAWLSPDGVIPGTAATQLSLIATDEVAVAISGVRAYPNGFEFTIHALGRREDFPWGVSPTDSVGDPRTRQAPEKALRLGVLYADGRRAKLASDRPYRLPEDEDDRGYLTFVEVGRRGTDRQWTGDFWVNPLPADGPVTFVASWLLHGVAEARAELDSSAIHEAAGRVMNAWPDA